MDVRAVDLAAGGRDERASVGARPRRVCCTTSFGGVAIERDLQARSKNVIGGKNVFSQIGEVDSGFAARALCYLRVFP